MEIGLRDIINGFLFTVVVVMYGMTHVYDMSVSISEIPTPVLHNAIAYKNGDTEMCEFSLNVETRWPVMEDVVVEGGKGSFLFFNQKWRLFTSRLCNTENIFGYVMNQLRAPHLITNVMASEHVWKCLAAITTVSAILYVWILEPFISAVDRPELSERIRTSEAAFLEAHMRVFLFEKFIILGYVIVSTPPSRISNKIPTMVQEPTSHTTDVTLFAIWFALVWAVSSLCIVANHRFEQLSPELCPSEQKYRFIYARIQTLQCVCLCVSSSMASLAGILACYLLNPLYATFLLIDSVKLIAICLLMCLRVFLFIKRGYDPNSQRTVLMLKRPIEIASHLASAFQYLAFILMGCIVCGFLLPAVFVTRFTYHIHKTGKHVIDHFYGVKPSRFIELI